MQTLKSLASNIKNYLTPTPEYLANIRIAKWIKLQNNSQIAIPLDLSFLDLTHLPKIPPNCYSLDCSHNKLTVIDQPLQCSYLYCYDNQLVSLPELPNCKILSCGNNKLTTLPELSECSVLYCAHNQLTTLPELPKCKTLSCYNNNLSALPALPVCTHLDFLDTNVSTLPYIPKGVSFFCNYRYLYISKREAIKFGFRSPTPNYNKFARIIQRKYKNHMKVKYTGLLNSYLLKGPTGIVCAYVC
jgi:hypothetical protein